MPSSYNRATGAIDSFTTGTLTGVVSGSDHGNKGDAMNKVQAQVVKESPPNVTWPEFGAVGDGSTDCTAAFTAALADSGAAHVPAGVYRVGDLAVDAFQELTGEGPEKSVLKAKTSATYTVTMDSGKLFTALRDLSIDGNAKASKGLLIRGGEGTGSQGQLLDRVHVRYCSVGLTVGAATGTEGGQVDKNTYIGFRAADCDVGAHINSNNAQEQVFINPDFVSCVTGVEMKSGTLDFLGGQFQGTSVGTSGINMLTGGGSLQWVRLTGTIFEFGHASSIDIKATASAWPAEGVVLNQCVLAGLTSNVSVNTGGILISELTRFNAGGIDITGDDFTFHDYYSTFALGATYNPTGTNDRRVLWATDGVQLETGALGKIQIRPHLGIDIQESSEPANPAANTGRLFTKDNGSGKTQLCVRFASGVTQVISTEP